MRKALIFLLPFLASALYAQWLDHVDPKIPRTSKGKLNLTAAAPRAANGKPDLSGAWVIEPPKPGEIERLFPGISVLSVVGDDPSQLSKYFIDFLADFSRDAVPMRPAAAELFAKHLATATDNPSTNCLPQGIPRAEMLPAPFKIVQQPGYFAILYEVDSNFREIYMDGRKLPVEPFPS